MKNYREVKIGPYSAYAIAKKNGFEGTEEEWLESLKPPAVDPTLSEEGKAADAKVTGDALATKAVIDDTAVGTDAWSSKHIVDMLCPPLEETGNPVQCYPVAGYPLGCKVSWAPTQDGSGDPSPENVRPIKGRDSVTVNQADGLRAWKLLTLDGTENWSSRTTVESSGYISYSLQLSARSLTGICSHYKKLLYEAIRPEKPTGETGCYLEYSMGAIFNVHFESKDSWESYLAAQYAAGTPVQIAYKLEKPVVVPDTNGIFFSEQPAQGGSGDPSPDNIRPILLNNAVQVGQTATLTLPHTIYGGTVDAVTGEGNERWKLLDDFDSYNYNKGGEEAGWVQSDAAVAWYVYDSDLIPNRQKIVANVFLTTKKDIVTDVTPYSIGSGNGFIAFRLPRSVAATKDDVRNWLKEHNAQIAFEVKSPTPIVSTGAPQPIPALSGVNTVITDADSVTVTGRADPIKRITDLEDAVASMT